MPFVAGGPGISAQGTLIALSPDPNWPDNNPQGGSLSFTTIAELGDIDPPEMSRKEIETTVQNSQDDRFVVGIRRKGDLVFKLNFVPSDSTQDHLTGLQYRWNAGSRDIYQITYPDGVTSGSQWLFSGWIKSIKPGAHVDTKLEATVTVRPTGGHKWVSAT